MNDTYKNIDEIGRIKDTDLSNYNPLSEKISELEARIKTLSDICIELNPYEAISDELKMKMMDFHILDFSDPFKVTNTLLMLLEDSIDELHVMKPYDDSENPVKEIF